MKKKISAILVVVVLFFFCFITSSGVRTEASGFITMTAVISLLKKNVSQNEGALWSLKWQ